MNVLGEILSADKGIFAYLLCIFCCAGRPFSGGQSGAGGGTAGATTPPPLDPTIYEIAIVVMGSYLAYLVAEVVGMSGIVALFFSGEHCKGREEMPKTFTLLRTSFLLFTSSLFLCLAGICHAHYSHYNVSSDARITLRRFFEVAAFLSELFVFAYLGLQVATMSHSFDFGLFFSAIPMAIASRAANVFPCTRLVNRYRHNKKIPQRMRRMLWAVGLRGAVAYGLVVNMPRADSPGQYGIPAIETAALLVVVASTLVLGSATGPLLRHLELEGRTDEDVYAAGWEEEGGAPGGPGLGVESGGRSVFHERFKEFDDAMLKPLFGGKQGREEEEGSLFGSEHGEDGMEGPSLRRPLFDEQHYFFNRSPEEGGNSGGSYGAAMNASPPQHGQGQAGNGRAPAQQAQQAPQQAVGDAIEFGEDLE